MDEQAVFASELALHEWMRVTVQRIFKTQSAWAEHLNVSQAHVSAVLNGVKRPSPRMLDDLGLERVVIYRRKSAKD